jgi:hypothetical protein
MKYGYVSTRISFLDLIPSESVSFQRQISLNTENLYKLNENDISELNEQVSQTTYQYIGRSKGLCDCR